MKKIIPLLFVLCFPALRAQVARDTLAYREIPNIPYLETAAMKADSLQQLNLVLPEGVERPPLLLWIGGGAWSFVNRHMEMALARKFAREGIAVASVGHRLSQGKFRPTDRTHGVRHPAHIKDIAAAFRWLRNHAETYGYDEHNIFVGGFSSGGHLAALLAMDHRYLASHDLDTKAIKGIIPVAGTFDINHYYSVFLNHEDPDTRPLAETHVKDVFGDTTADFTDASPVTYLDQLNTPMLLISERGLYDYTKLFEERLREAHYENCQILHLFDHDHAGLWRDISHAQNSQTRHVMIDFIKRNAMP